MPAIGDTLREARMRQNLDIADVESYTKIRAKYLRALENEEWGLLPGPTFVRTFLRTYAEAVGIDPHPLVDEYRRTYEPSEDVEPVQRAPRQPSSSGRGGGGGGLPRPRSGPPSPLVLIGGVVVVIVVVLVVLGSIGNDSGGGSSDQAANTETTRSTPARRPARQRAKPRPRATGVTLRISPAVPTYACLDAGDGTNRVFEGILSSARTFRNARELRVNLGKRQVQITANGKRVQVPGGADPYGLRVTRTAASEITDGPRPCA